MIEDDSGSETNLSEINLNVEFLDNYDNTVDLVLDQIRPSGATVTYAIKDELDDTEIQEWSPIINNRVNVPFTPEEDKEPKYVFFKVSKSGYSDSMYEIDLLQNCNQYENTSAAYYTGS